MSALYLSLFCSLRRTLLFISVLVFTDFQLGLYMVMLDFLQQPHVFFVLSRLDGFLELAYTETAASGFASGVGGNHCGATVWGIYGLEDKSNELNVTKLC